MPKRIRRVREGAPGNGPVATPAPRPRAYLTKTCSACQAVKPKLSLSARVFRCEHCGLVIDRDRNAAINLKRQVAQSGWETINGRGADQKTKPSLAGGSEASTPHRLAGQDGDRSPVTASCE